MIEAKGDLWELGKDADAIVITTNCTVKANGENVMGGGCARQAAILWPWLPADLGARIKKRGNGLHVFHYSSEQVLVAMPTKIDVRRPSTLAMVVRSVIELDDLAHWYDWKKVVMPRPGCGLGGLKWKDVKPVMEDLDDRFTVVTYG